MSEGRVFLHIGGPKTGTTFLQAVLWRQADVALRQGLLLPLTKVADHYRAYLDLTGQPNWTGAPGPVDGMWARLVGEIAAHDGDALVSTEFLVHATPEHAARAIGELTALGREVHVVITARRLERFLPSQWQETIKTGRAWTFADYLRETREGTPAGLVQRRLWDYAALVDTWSQGIPAEQVHVVTVPPAAASRSLLWDRFASVVGLDPGAFSLDVPRTNDSLGAEQVEVLRGLNAALAGRLPWPGPYKVNVKRPVVRRILASRPGAPIQVPAAELPWVRTEAASLVAGLSASGVQVVGDLADLLGDDDATPEPAAAPDLDPQRVGEEAVAALAELVLAHAATRQKQRAKIARLRRRLAAQRPPAPGRVRRTARRVRRGLRRLRRIGHG